MLRSISLCLTVAALGAADITLVPSTTTPSVGQTITVAVRATGGPAVVAAGQVRIDFDATRLSYVGATLGSGGGTLTINNAPAAVNAAGRLRALLDEPAVPGGTVMTVTFTAIAAGSATAAAGSPGQPFGTRLFDAALAEHPVVVAGPVALVIGTGSQAAPVITQAATAVSATLVMP
jgi:hypothetical protein